MQNQWPTEDLLKIHAKRQEKIILYHVWARETEETKARQMVILSTVHAGFRQFISVIFMQWRLCVFVFPITLNKILCQLFYCRIYYSICKQNWWFINTSITLILHKANVRTVLVQKRVPLKLRSEHFVLNL